MQPFLIQMITDINSIKQRYGIIGFDAALDRAIDVAVQVAPTDLSVLITGESGVGKENFPRIIHDNSPRRHAPYIAINCGAIPEGTIDSELFGHEKGAFTGADKGHKGYFETADGGTIFLDEVADLPLATQIRLLRVLENGEYFRVGSAEVQRTNVRVVAATNVNIGERIARRQFREDLYYRLNSVPIQVPALRDRKGDILPLFMKFASDMSVRYHFPPVELTEDAVEKLKEYAWPGNIRQLKHVTAQISLLERNRKVDAEQLTPYLKSPLDSHLPALVNTEKENNDQFQREILFKFIAKMQHEINELQEAVKQLRGGESAPSAADLTPLPNRQMDVEGLEESLEYEIMNNSLQSDNVDASEFDVSEVIEESGATLAEIEKIAIKRALDRNNQNRRLAAQELGVSERTIFRKIQDYGL